MKRFSCTVVVVFLCAAFAGFASADDARRTTDGPEMIQAPANPYTMTEAQWADYCVLLQDALASDTESMKLAALRLVVQYGDLMKFSRSAVFDVVRLYRDHENDRVRRMAVVALGQINDSWGNDFLLRSIPFEKQEAVAHTLRVVVATLQGEVPPVGLQRSF